jgi:hypothetical protein
LLHFSKTKRFIYIVRKIVDVVIKVMTIEQDISYSVNHTMKLESVKFFILLISTKTNIFNHMYNYHLHFSKTKRFIYIVRKIVDVVIKVMTIEQDISFV